MASDRRQRTGAVIFIFAAVFVNDHGLRTSREIAVNHAPDPRRMA
jgi:hypothetical protein